MPGHRIIEVIETCRYCRKRPIDGLCGGCKRVLCAKCKKGLGCPDRCHSRPDGTGVW